MLIQNISDFFPKSLLKMLLFYLIGVRTFEKIKRIGIKDTFGESGSLNDLFCKYGLTAENIVKEVKEIIKKKTNKLYNF